MGRHAFWTAHVPPHWDVVYAGRLFREVSSKGHTKEPLLSVTQDRGVIPRDQLEERVVMPQGELDSFKLVREGNFVISLRSADGGIEHSAHRGLVSPAYVVMEPSASVHHGYFKRLLKASPVVRALGSLVTGIRDGKSIPYAQFRTLPLVVPPRADQEAIARFLEEKERDIERYLATKRRMIQECNERETAIASSRFDELIGGYSSARLSDVCDITSGYAFDSSGFVSDTDGVRLVRGANVGIGHLRWTDENTVRWPAASAPEVARWALQIGDLVIGLNRPWIDGGLRLAEVRSEDLPCLVLQRVARLRARPKVLGRFLLLMLRTPRLLWELEPDFTGVGTPYIDEHRMKRFRIPLPPLSKQREIIEFHASQTRDVEDALRILEREIAVMEEYRTRLIADAVTGQIDVRRLG